MLNGPPPTPYNALKYVNFQVGSQGLATGIRFHSQPNGGTTTTALALQGEGLALSKDYSASKVKDFQLFDFWFGCKVSSGQQANGGPAQACTIAVTGYKQNPQYPSVCDVVGVSFSPCSTRLYSSATLRIFYLIAPKPRCLPLCPFSRVQPLPYVPSLSHLSSPLLASYKHDQVLITDPA